MTPNAPALTPPPAKARLGAAPARISRLLRPHASSLGAFLVLAGGAGVGYLAQLGTARLLGPESFGVYAYALAWVTLLAYLSTLGFHVSLLRLVPTCRASGDWPGVCGVIRFARLGAAGAGGALAALGAVAILATEGAASELTAALLIGLAAAPLLALQLVGAATARAFGSVVLALAPERLGRDALALAMAAALVFGGVAAPAASTAMAAMLASALAMLLLVERVVRRIRPLEMRDVRPRFAARDWIRPTLPLTAIMVADVVMTRSGVIVLGLVGDMRAAGVFAVALAVATLAALPRMAVAAAFAPTVADLHARGDRVGLQALTGRSAWLSLAGAACVAAPLIAAAPFLLFLFGEEFVSGVPAVVVLVLAQLVAAAAGPQQHLMTMTGREGAGAAMQAGAAALGLALCFALAPPFGAVGAASAAAVGTIAWNIAMAWFALTRLGLRPGLIAAHRASAPTH